MVGIGDISENCAQGYKMRVNNEDGIVRFRLKYPQKTTNE